MDFILDYPQDETMDECLEDHRRCQHLGEAAYDCLLQNPTCETDCSSGLDETFPGLAEDSSVLALTATLRRGSDRGDEAWTSSSSCFRAHRKVCGYDDVCCCSEQLREYMRCLSPECFPMYLIPGWRSYADPCEFQGCAVSEVQQALSSGAPPRASVAGSSKSESDNHLHHREKTILLGGILAVQGILLVLLLWWVNRRWHRSVKRALASGSDNDCDDPTVDLTESHDPESDGLDEPGNDTPQRQQ